MAANTNDIKASNSPESCEDFEVDDESNPAQSAQGQPQDQTSPGSTAQPPPRNIAPLQKRRRVTRACDECRRKKIKCDGKQPCTHCTVYSYDCTYDQPSNRRRNPAPQYIEALESRLQRAETLLRAVLPNVDLNDPNPNIEALIQHRQAGAAKGFAEASPGGTSSDAAEQHQLHTMIASTGQLDLDDKGHWDFHGGSSGTVFVKRMREQFGGLFGVPEKAQNPFLPKLPRPYPAALLDSPKSSADSPIDGNLPSVDDLPSRERARSLCVNALDTACCLLRFVHQPTFFGMFDRIYDLPPDAFGNDEHQFLPLLYVVLALGCMFEPPSDDKEQTYKDGISHGLKYFKASRQMMDITDCRDIVSLQALLFMILFLQATANLSTCYSYIGIALRSALRMGLHRNLAGCFNPIERETRRKLFWIIRKMDTYVSALLGFPMLLSNDDIDQELPLEIDDEYLTMDGALPMPQGKVSLITASNAHTRLMTILAKVIKYIYPIKGIEESVQGTTGGGYVISHSRIGEIERDLTNWLDKLPMGLRPGGNGSPELLRVQQLLRLAFAHVQMMLYRPFIHYISRKANAGGKRDQRAYTSAAACVNVARNIVHIAAEMKRRGLLMGAYWFTMYTTFFAILSLVFFVLENPEEDGVQNILADAMAGKDALNGLAKRSQAADRCSEALKVLFEQLPQKLNNSRPTAILAKKKRSAPSPKLGPLSISTMQDRPSSQPVPNFVPGARAITFPVSTPTQGNGSQRSSVDGSRFQLNTLSTPNLRQNFHEMLSPADFSNVGTPDSASTATSLPQTFPQQQLDSANGGNCLTDLKSMMFPSADPFAYPPNQPMMKLDDADSLSMLDGTQAPVTFFSNNGLPAAYDDLEGQLFGPIPPYMAQGAPGFDFQEQIGDGGMMSGMGGAPAYPMGAIPNGDMNFVLSGEGDGWSNMLGEQQFRQ